MYSVKKSIFLLSSEFPPLPGGIGNHAFNLARMLVAKGYMPLVLTDHRSKNSEADEESFDASLHFKVYRVRRYHPSIMTYLLRVFLAFRILCKYKPDVIIASGRFHLWLASFLSLLFRRPRYFAVIHGSEIGIGRSVEKRLTKWSLGRFKEVIAVSRYTGNLLDAVRPGLEIKIIPNGFIPLKLEKTKRDVIHLPGNPALITVGNVSRRKGQQNVIKALPCIREHFPQVHYHIVGIPSEKSAFSKLAEELGVTDAITFHGAVSQEVLPLLLAGSDLFLMLSEQQANGDVEGFGIAIIEANSIGLPAIGSIGCGIEDAIYDGLNGRLVDPSDQGAINEAIQDILKNYERYVSEAKSWALQFEWDKTIQRYLDIID